MAYGRREGRAMHAPLLYVPPPVDNGPGSRERTGWASRDGRSETRLVGRRGIVPADRRRCRRRIDEGRAPRTSGCGMRASSSARWSRLRHSSGSGRRGRRRKHREVGTKYMERTPLYNGQRGVRSSPRNALFREDSSFVFCLLIPYDMHGQLHVVRNLPLGSRFHTTIRGPPCCVSTLSDSCPPSC
jgi:hypothetical protein